MRKENLKQMKGNRGITLIALVVTIVVLLILAGITISTLFGDNGIITAARKAADDTKTAENDTEKGLGNLVNDMNKELGINDGIVEPKNIEDWIYEKDETTNTITINKYKGEDTEVVIPNSIGGIKVTKIGENEHYPPTKVSSLWNDNICSKTTGIYIYKQETIEKVIISDGIEEIRDYCFVDSSNLKEVQLGNTIKSIGYHAFSGCTSLTNITIPSSVNTMRSSVFYNIPLITVKVPFKEGSKPDGWWSSWNDSYTGVVRVQYQDQSYYQ